MTKISKKRSIRPENRKFLFSCFFNFSDKNSAIGDSYDGHRLPEVIDEAWIRELMEFYREQKKLPIRYMFTRYYYECVLRAYGSPF